MCVCVLGGGGGEMGKTRRTWNEKMTRLPSTRVVKSSLNKFENKKVQKYKYLSTTTTGTFEERSLKEDEKRNSFFKLNLLS